MLVAVIIACEVGFWVFLLSGLVARYPLRRPRLGAALLVCAPLVDLVLLAATVLDLRAGATASFAHGLAAAYLGFSVAFGHGLIRSMDARFAHRFDGAPKPAGPPRYGMARARHEWQVWRKALLAWAVACGLLLTAVVAVGDASRTAEFVSWMQTLTLGLVGWLVLGPVAYTVFPKRAPRVPVGSRA